MASMHLIKIVMIARPGPVKLVPNPLIIKWNLAMGPSSE